MSVESTSLHAWISGNLIGNSAAVANGSEDGYISRLSLEVPRLKLSFLFQVEIDRAGRTFPRGRRGMLRPCRI
jgi:hypothetical protein